MAGKETPKVASAPARILIADSDLIILDSLSAFLGSQGYEVSTADSLARAKDCLQAGRFNLVITDTSTADSHGWELLRYVKGNFSEVVVIVTTGYGTIESAVEAMKQGAYEYLTKPIIDDDLRLAVGRALQQQQILLENRQLKMALNERYSFSNIVGADFRMAKVFELIETVADSPTTVLVTGESGTGKSLIARAIHAHSSRRNGPFVEVSCGALPETLLESELFGFVRGAFTHAFADKDGKFAAADGGTLFLDEISTASPQLQVKLLRVLQERKFEPVGSNQTREVDVRVILATNRDLMMDVQAGQFRQDLYYRINVVSVELPPLRERISDIQLLAEHFLRKFLAVSRKRISGFDKQAMDVMQRYSWPGNVRELENCVERAVVLSRGGKIMADDLPPAVLKEAAGTPSGIGVIAAEGLSLARALEESERAIITASLAANGGSRRATASQLAIDRTTLFKKMRKYGLMGA
jgi:DNA-binding NtrC family response regulator